MQEEEIKEAFVAAFNQILGDKEQHIQRFMELLPLLADTSSLEDQLNRQKTLHAEKIDALRKYMEANTRIVQDQAEYNRNFAAMSEECQLVEAEIARIERDILSQKGRKEEILRCLDELQRCGDILTEFDQNLWHTTVDSVTVNDNRSLTFLFRDGTEIVVKIPETK